jgi:hypothetical protein
MKQSFIFSFLFLSIFTFGVTSVHAQAEGPAYRENNQVSNATPDGTLNWEAKKTKYSNNLPVSVELYDENGDFVCKADQFQPHSSKKYRDDVVVSTCGDFEVSAYFHETKGYDHFVYSVFSGDSKPFAMAAQPQIWADNVDRDLSLGAVLEHAYNAPQGYKY